MAPYGKYTPSERTAVTPVEVNEFEQIQNIGTIHEYRGEREKTFWERVGIGGSITSVPLMFNGTVFFGACDKNFYAVGLDGKEKWRFATQGTIQSWAIRVGERVCFGSGDKNVYMLDSGTGELIWKAATGGQIGGSPVEYKGTVYVGSADGNLYALDSGTGERRWTFRTSYPLITPLIYRDKIFVGYNGGNFYCLNLNGELQWTFTAGAWVAAWPAAAEGDKLFFGSGDKNLYCIGTDGQLQWKLPFREWVLSPVVSDGRLYVGSGESLHCVSVTGEKLWKVKTEDAVSYITVAGGTVYFGSYDNKLYAMDAETGEVHWMFETKGFVHGAPAVSGGRVVFGSWDCNLYCLTMDGKLLWKFPTTMSTPSVIGEPEQTEMRKIETIIQSEGRERPKEYKGGGGNGGAYETTMTVYGSGLTKSYLSSRKKGYVGG